MSAGTGAGSSATGAPIDVFVGTREICLPDVLQLQERARSRTSRSASPSARAPSTSTRWSRRPRAGQPPGRSSTWSPAAELRLLGEQLLAQDVGVPAVLGELAQHVQVDPAQRQRAAAVAAEHVVDREGRTSPGARPRRPRGGPAGRWRSCRRPSSTNESSGVAGIPISARDRHVTASSNQTFSTKVACLTRPSSVVREGTRERRACSSVSPSRLSWRARRCSSRNVSNWICEGLVDDVVGERRGQGGHAGSLPCPVGWPRGPCSRRSRRTTARAALHRGSRDHTAALAPGLPRGLPVRD